MSLEMQKLLNNDVWREFDVWIRVCGGGVARIVSKPGVFVSVIGHGLARDNLALLVKRATNAIERARRRIRHVFPKNATPTGQLKQLILYRYYSPLIVSSHVQIFDHRLFWIITGPPKNNISDTYLSSVSTQKYCTKIRTWISSGKNGRFYLF